MKIELKTRLSADSAADEHDVRQLKKALNILGYYTPYEQTGITGTPDARLFSALKKFQKDSNLPASGIIKPDDPTLDTLNDALTEAPQGYYIWRTAGDERVRPEHAQYNGTKRAWNDSPNPGEDFNCRCWAEPVQKMDFVPPRKPSCKEKEENLHNAEETFKNIKDRMAIIFKDLEVLINEHNNLIGDLQKKLGTQIAAKILDIPLKRIGKIGDILQELAGNLLNDKVMEEAEAIIEQLNTIKQKIKNKEDQLKITKALLEKAKENLDNAHEKLKQCQSNIPRKQ